MTVLFLNEYKYVKLIKKHSLFIISIVKDKFLREDLVE